MYCKNVLECIGIMPWNNVLEWCLGRMYWNDLLE